MIGGGDTLKVISDKPFSSNLHECLKNCAHTQQELAKEIGLDPKVLSRKLRNYQNAYLTEQQVWNIIRVLVHWKGITTQDEVLRFLDLARLELEPDSYSAKQWQELPLQQATNKRVLNGHTLPPHTHQHPIPVSAPLHNLPAINTPLIGRESSVAQLRQRLSTSEERLFILTGPGGCGKTRLALKVARELLHTFPQGVWFVPLASVRNPLLVPQSIMQALEIRPIPGSTDIQSLITYLEDKHVLLLLDNFEHIAEAATVVSELLTALPLLKVLVTSRSILHLYGEINFAVPSLDYPDSMHGLGMKELLHYSAIKLFVDRAHAVQPHFTLTPENAESVRQICARVDGLPLALELAAARIKALPPEKLVARLAEARLLLLTGGALDLPERHKTLRKTISWSYDLLPPAEQVWFARLSVFNGGWSLEVVETMLHTLDRAQSQEAEPVAESALDLLVRFMDTSLVALAPVIGDQVRFTLLETLREFALEQLKGHLEFERLRDWHSCYYLYVAEAAEVGLHGSQQLMWRERLVAERDNFRSALAWSIRRARAAIDTVIGDATHFTTCTSVGAQEVGKLPKNDPAYATAASSTDLLAIDVALRLAAALRPYWEWQGHLVEGRRWQEAALEIALPKDPRKTTLMARGKALSEMSRMACLQNEQQRSAELADESIALWRQLDSPEGLATALWYRGWAAHALNDHQRSKEGYEEALPLLANSSDVWLRAQILFYLGDALGFLSDYEQMHANYAQSLILFEQVGDQSAIADVLKDQGGMFILQGQLARAIDNLLRSLELSHALGYKQFVANCTSLLGYAIGLREEPDPETATLQASLLWGAGEGLRTSIGSISWLDSFPPAQIIRQQILSRVSESSWQSAWQSGYALSEEQTVAACMALQREPVGARG